MLQSKGGDYTDCRLPIANCVISPDNRQAAGLPRRQENVTAETPPDTAERLTENDKWKLSLGLTG